MGTIEMRKLRRIPFSSTEKVDAVCRYPAGDNMIITFHVANISEGGLGLMTGRSHGVSIGKNDILYLDQITGYSQLGFLKELELEVKWILDSNLLSSIGLGCCFLNLPEQFRLNIVQFMNGIVSCGVRA